MPFTTPFVVVSSVRPGPEPPLRIPWPNPEKCLLGALPKVSGAAQATPSRTPAAPSTLLAASEKGVGVLNLIGPIDDMTTAMASFVTLAAI